MAIQDHSIFYAYMISPHQVSLILAVHSITLRTTATCNQQDTSPHFEQTGMEAPGIFFTRSQQILSCEIGNERKQERFQVFVEFALNLFHFIIHVHSLTKLFAPQLMLARHRKKYKMRFGLLFSVCCLGNSSILRYNTSFVV